jgi:hypothetical protein
MKLLTNFSIITFFIFVLGSCCNDKDESKNDLGNLTIHPQLQNLKKPDIVLNILENGLFNSNIINSIYLDNYNNTSRKWDFNVFDNSNRIKSIKFTNPNNLCQNAILNYYYENNLISKIEIISVNVCQEFNTKRELKYNYEQNLLVSIFAKYYYSDINTTNKLTEVGEDYFSYNPNGTIAEIYSNIRPASEPVHGYQKKSFLYDSNNNVIEVKQEEYNSNTYNYKFIFDYNNEINPLKGIYVFSGEIGGLPNYGIESSLGPIFLSNNCIKSVKSEPLNSQNNFDNTLILTTNLSNQKITDFGSEASYQYWFRNYVN